MSFDLRPSPLLPPFGGLDDDPENFIATGESGLRGCWVHEGGILVPVLEDLDADMFADIDDAVAELDRLYASPTAERVSFPEQRSCGYLVFQRHPSGVIRIEYVIEVLRGQELDPAASPHQDERIETALRHWLQDHEREVTATVDERSGAL